MPLTAINPGTLLTTTSTDFTGANSTSAQPIFNTTEDVLTVQGATSYLMEACFHIHTTGTTSHGMSLLFGGTATLTSIGYDCLDVGPATEVFGSPVIGWVTVATATNVLNAVATATHSTIILEGIVRVNAGGTFIPQYQWTTNAPGVAGVTLANSYFQMTPFGSNTAKAVGNWG